VASKTKCRGCAMGRGPRGSVGSLVNWGLMLAVVLLVILGEARAAGPAGPWQVVFAQDTLANDWRRVQAEGLAAEFAKDARIRFRYTDAQGNTARQVQDMEDALAQQVDLLIVSPRDAELMAPVVAKARRQGTRVILLSRRVVGDDHDVFIRADNADIGRRAARRLMERLRGKGAVLVLQGVPTASTTIERTEGFVRELRRAPGMRIVALRAADYLRDKAVAAVEATMAEGIHFDAIYAQSDSMAAGARAALRRAGINPRHLPIVGIDYIAEAQAAIRAGEQDASFIYPTFAREGADAARRLLMGRPVPKEIVVPSIMVTRDNVDRLAPIF